MENKTMLCHTLKIYQISKKMTDRYLLSFNQLTLFMTFHDLLILFKHHIACNLSIDFLLKYSFRENVHKTILGCSKHYESITEEKLMKRKAKWCQVSVFICINFLSINHLLFINTRTVIL